MGGVSLPYDELSDNLLLMNLQSSSYIRSTFILQTLQKFDQ